jgi:hypothetical protein
MSARWASRFRRLRGSPASTANPAAPFGSSGWSNGPAVLRRCRSAARGASRAGRRAVKHAPALRSNGVLRVAGRSGQGPKDRMAAASDRLRADTLRDHGRAGNGRTELGDLSMTAVYPCPAVLSCLFGRAYRISTVQGKQSLSVAGNALSRLRREGPIASAAESSCTDPARLCRRRRRGSSWSSMQCPRDLVMRSGFCFG